ncbi:Replication a kda dna-binding subunit-like protein [Daphnia magna]|uniref:Replication a kDa dna-binding subunit-like protein n=1 Tax=Daphnia magna TaxID=35525 RepID=A0A164TGH8_9CRUS|nr:Replication a kda dna-binding subunit-like protein [Daphnia magna]
MTSVVNNDRSEKRELYAQGALIMFIPFLTLSYFVKDSDRNWWAAYLRNKLQLAKDVKSMTILGNIQNYYESFYRSGINSREPEFPNDVNLLRTRREQDRDNDDTPAVDLLEAEQDLQTAETTDNAHSIEDPLVAYCGASKDRRKPVAKEEENRDVFKSGRASLPVDATNAQRNDPADNPNQTILDHVIGTRVELLSKIESALLENQYTVCPSVGSSALVQLEANIPTMQEHSHHWTLIRWGAHGNAIESMRGRHLWRTELTDVIEFTENHRQTTDRPWADSLERWRINQPTDDDIAAVNNRFVDDLDLSLDCPQPQTTKDTLFWVKKKLKGVPFPKGGWIGSRVESAVRKGMAQAAELPSVKSTEVEVVYDSIYSFKVNAINTYRKSLVSVKNRVEKTTVFVENHAYVSGKDKPGTMMSFDFEDASAKKIKGVAFNDAIKTLDKEIFVGKIISKATVQKRFGRPVAGYHNCELLLFKHSQFELLEDDHDYVVPVEQYRPLSELDAGDVEIDSSINVLAVVSSVGAMQNMEIKKSYSTIRDAAYLEVQLVNPSLKQGEVTQPKYLTCTWGTTAADVRRHPTGYAIKLKGAVVVSREGRLSLKATGRMSSLILKLMLLKI